MLTPQSLDRVSCSYRRGYYDGYDGRGCKDPHGPDHPFDRPFANADYVEGHKAGANDAKWERHFTIRTLPN